jgi:hypothetical protein
LDASPRSLAAGLALAASLAGAPLASQVPLTIEGRVVRVAAGDSLPVAGAPVTLHRVGRTAQGAIDSMRSGPDGRFRFRSRGDSAAIYLVSARHAGIEYFSEPIRAPGASAIRLAVSDTSSIQAVRLGARHVIIRSPDEFGTRAVLDLLSIQNDGPDTRVGRDSLSPSWQVVLPPGATSRAVEEGDVSPTAIQFRGDTMMVFAPLAPGRKNVMVSYRLPILLDRPSWSAPADSFDVLLEEGDASVRGAGLHPVAPVTLMGSALRRWTATPPTGASGEVIFAGTPANRGRLLFWMVALLAAIVLGGAVLAFQRSRRGGDGAVVAADPPDRLIDDLARLDAKYAGGPAAVSAEEWAAYQRERGRLKAAALARRGMQP